jgi:hypothetical protein
MTTFLMLFFSPIYFKEKSLGEYDENKSGVRIIMGIEPTEAILLMIVSGLIISSIVIPMWNEFVIESKSALHSMIPTMKNLWIYLLIIIGISPFFYKWLFRKLEKRKERKRELKKGESEIEEILKENIKLYDLLELKRFINKISERLENLPEELIGYEEELKEFLLKSEKCLEELKHKETLLEINRKKEEAEERINLINQEIEEKKREMAQEKYNILLSLKPDENTVYKKNSLNNNEIKILKGEGYSQLNEFCVYEQKRIPVLIRSVLNHSPRHTFLVWSVKRLLKKINGIKHIEENLTKDADMTFTYEREIYALEIETGNLLGKHEQLKEKLIHLNRTYPEKWMFVVSNRDLFSKYKKLGMTATRNNLLEKLEKLLKITHTEIPYVF